MTSLAHLKPVSLAQASQEVCVGDYAQVILPPEKPPLWPELPIRHAVLSCDSLLQVAGTPGTLARSAGTRLERQSRQCEQINCPCRRRAEVTRSAESFKRWWRSFSSPPRAPVVGRANRARNGSTRRTQFFWFRPIPQEWALHKELSSQRDYSRSDEVLELDNSVASH